MQNIEREACLSKIKDKLEEIELEQKDGAKYYSVEELDAALKKIIEENPR